MDHSENEGEERRITKDNKQMKIEKWYQEIIDDCKRLVKEVDIRSRWEIGNNLLRIIKLPRKEIYGKKCISKIARCLGVSERYLYLCIQFRRNFKRRSKH